MATEACETGTIGPHVPSRFPTTISIDFIAAVTALLDPIDKRFLELTVRSTTLEVRIEIARDIPMIFKEKICGGGGKSDRFV